MNSENKQKIEKRIMNLSLIGSILFMIVEGIMAYITHSHSILMDCVFDVTDLIMIGPFLFLVPLLSFVSLLPSIFLFNSQIHLSSKLTFTQYNSIVNAPNS